MHIFNQGKYKNLHAQTEGELEAVRQTVLSDQDFYPIFLRSGSLMMQYME